MCVSQCGHPTLASSRSDGIETAISVSIAKSFREQWHTLECLHGAGRSKWKNKDRILQTDNVSEIFDDGPPDRSARQTCRDMITHVLNDTPDRRT